MEQKETGMLMPSKWLSSMLGLKILTGQDDWLHYDIFYIFKLSKKVSNRLRMIHSDIMVNDAKSGINCLNVCGIIYRGCKG